MESNNSGRWKKGLSGNAAGRPRGSGEVAKVRALIGAALPKVVGALTAKAIDGDVGAARLLLERTIAPLRASEAPAQVALSGTSLADQGREVLRAIALGELGPSQGSSLLVALAGLAKLVEVDELERRIAFLESRSPPAGVRC